MKITMLLATCVVICITACSPQSAIEKEAIESMQREHPGQFHQIQTKFHNDSIVILWAEYSDTRNADKSPLKIEYIYCVANGCNHEAINFCVEEIPPGVEVCQENTSNMYGAYVSQQAYGKIKDSILPGKNLKYEDALAYLSLKCINLYGRVINKNCRWLQITPAQDKTGLWEFKNKDQLITSVSEDGRFLVLKSTNTNNPVVNPDYKTISIVANKDNIWLEMNADMSFALTFETDKQKSGDLGVWSNVKWKKYSHARYDCYSDVTVLRTLLKEERPFSLILTPSFVMGREYENSRPIVFDFYPEGYNEALKQL